MDASETPPFEPPAEQNASEVPFKNITTQAHRGIPGRHVNNASGY